MYSYTSGKFRHSGFIPLSPDGRGMKNLSFITKMFFIFTSLIILVFHAILSKSDVELKLHMAQLRWLADEAVFPEFSICVINSTL
jgi:hypothetical protein